MQKKMQQFLMSIGLQDVERFDLDFVLVARNPYHIDKIDMAIEKQTPWDYALLEEFNNALATIRYPYSLRFSYACDITPQDVVNLLIDWHLALYQTTPEFSSESKRPNTITIGFEDESQFERNKAKLRELKSLLTYINYPYSLFTHIEHHTALSPIEMTVETPKPKIEAVHVPAQQMHFEEVKIPEKPAKPVQNQPEPAPEPIPEPAIEEPAPMVEEPAPEPIPEPVIEPEAEPISEPAPEVGSGPEPVEEPTAEPEADPLPEPVFTEPEVVKEPAPEKPMPEVAEEPVEPEPAPIAEEPAPEPIVVEDLNPEEWTPVDTLEEPNIADSEEEGLSGEELIERDRIASIEEGEEVMLKIKEENRRLMEEERNRKRVWSTGDYKPMLIHEIYSSPLCNVDFSGMLFEGEARTSRKGNLFGTFGIGDDSDAINIRVISSKRIPEEKVKSLQIGEYFRIRGAIDTDSYTGQRIIVAHFIDPISKPEPRGDEAPVKRVELHLHTNMSTMDGVASIDNYIELAGHMGMDALAITDHGSIQAFPAAQKKLKKYNKKNPEHPMKLIYGSELYMFDVKQNFIMNPSDQPLRNARYCVFDTETTGLSSRYDRIVEFGGVIIEGGNVVKRWDILINPEMDLTNHQEALAVNHIEEEELLRSPKMSEVLPQILEFIKGSILVAHNATFDVGFLNATLARFGMPPIDNPVIDTLPLSHYFFPFAGRHNEGALLKNLGLQIYNEREAHRADYDANALSEGWQVMMVRLEIEHPGITHRDLGGLNIGRGDPNWIIDSNDPNDPGRIRFNEQEEKFNAYCRHIHDYHAIVLCKNQAGLSDLYRIISAGHTTYLGRAGLPKTPRELLQNLRGNLLIGSACFNSEVFETAMTRTMEDLVQVVSFYDYIEIQPLENYSYLIHTGRVPNQESLIEVLRSIIEAAHKANKPVVATGDCHYLNPEDKILRDVYISAKSIGGGFHPLRSKARDHEGKPYPNPDQHFRSTTEMMASFTKWMSEAEAYEYVVTNSRFIADMISDEVEPVHDDLFKPDANLPHADVILNEICHKNFEERYKYLGTDNDPEVLEAIEITRQRMERELKGIIGNGYAVTYIIAARLIKMANDEPEHYIVGSRGSVGSSFAATMADITEVNPLPAHYHCPHCHYLHYEDAVKYKSGFDLPNIPCPKCGTLMHGDGQNIPFETFLGFAAEKVPDIDLNFEDESQKKAHNYCRILLGKDNVYRAGTIETVKEKTAYGFVRGYYEFMGINPDTINPAYIAFIASRCQGVKRTTGQHPGAIVVIPADHSLYDFMAIQHPADDLESDWLTTHYDFRAVHDEILKLDILGHVDPMAMRYYRDLTGVKIEDIPMNDPQVLKLFSSVEPLKMERNYLRSTTGAAALPEFGTNQGLQMLEETRPACFNDLLILSGLAHGTNVWASNAEDLIKSGKTLNEVIGCRDDIMTYLISMGVDKSASFAIMEDVRHGKRIKDEHQAEMRAHGVPEYYIESCNKIAYLFPRGHATAYVMMAVRVAYFKLYYPLHFYAVFFSIRSDDWDIKSMIEGEEAVIAKIEAYRERMNDRTNKLSNKEENIYKTLLIALEMLERGYHFSNIDLYRSDYKMFTVDEKNKALIPPFTVIDGLGESAGISICEARILRDRNGNIIYDEDGKPRIKEFISKQDLLSRASRLNGSNLAKLDELGVLEGMSEENQLTLF